MASGSTISDNSTLPRFRPTVSPAPMAPSQLKVSVPSAKLASMVGKAAVGIPSAVATSGDASTNAAPLTSQCAKVFATMITVNPCPDSANCSNVPSSASLLNSASNDRSDDSSAATQSTPGAMSRSSDNCTLRPSGNRVVTMRKNTSGCSSCSGRRKLRHSSRRTTSVMACQAPTLIAPIPSAASSPPARDHGVQQRVPCRRRSRAPPAMRRGAAIQRYRDW